MALHLRISPISILVFLLVICVTPVRCEEVVLQSPPFYNLTAQQAAQLIKNEKNLVIVDVRTVKERAQGAIARSHLIPIGSIFQQQYSLSKEDPLLLYCAVGGRSYAAANILQKRGFRRIYNLEGGIKAWLKEGLPVVVEEQ